MAVTGTKQLFRTLQLIDAALAAKSTYDQASATMSSSTAALNQAKTDLEAANQALHDDLADNGARCVIDTTTIPPTVTIYMAIDPDCYTTMQVPVAE